MERPSSGNTTNKFQSRQGPRTAPEGGDKWGGTGQGRDSEDRSGGGRREMRSREDSMTGSGMGAPSGSGVHPKSPGGQLCTLVASFK